MLEEHISMLINTVSSAFLSSAFLLPSV